jgi:acyl-coenzyme A thioesterase PaaI-like protein
VGVTEFDASLPAINEDTIDHHCFGCGNANPHGLRLRFRPLDDGRVWADFTPARNHEGYLGMTHGGILSTVLDEGMSWAVTYAGDLGVTARLAVTFRQPARIGETLRIIGGVTQRRSRTIETRGEVIALGTGTVLATAEGRFVRVSREQAASWRDQYGAHDEDTVFGQAANRNARGSGIARD